MGDDLVKRAREALNGVTPGPWHVSPDGFRVTDKRVTFDDDGARCGETPNICIFAETEANAIFIAASRELVPAMADRIEELEAKLAKAVEVLGAWTSLLDHCSIEEGVCCCGDNMEGHAHPMNCGHSPVDHGAYVASNLSEHTRAVLAEINGGGDT